MGWGRVRLYCVLAAVVSHVADAIFFKLLKDDRLVGDPQPLIDRMREAVDVVFGLPDLVWSRLACMAQLLDGPDDLRQMCCRAVYTFCSGVSRKLISRLTSRPLTLSQGDISANLDELEAEEDEPSDLVTRNLWNLLRKELMPRTQLEGVVREFHGIGCTAIAAEHPHLGITLIRKFHKRYSEKQLLLRAAIYNAIRVVPKVINYVPAETKLARMKALCPLKLSGYNIHVKLTSQAHQAAEGVTSTPLEEQTQILRDAASSWQGMSKTDKRTLRGIAHEERKQHQHALERQIEQAERDLEIRKEKDDARCSVGNSFGGWLGFTFTWGDMQAMQDMWQGSNFG